MPQVPVASPPTRRGERGAYRVRLPGLPVRLPPADQLARYAGIALLAGLEILDWPVALALAAGTCSPSSKATRRCAP